MSGRYGSDYPLAVLADELELRPRRLRVLRQVVLALAASGAIERGQGQAAQTARPVPRVGDVAVFRFDNKRPVYLIYGFKRGAFWPFIPKGEGKERDNAEELELKAQLEKELPIEPDLTRWLALFDAPI